MINKVKILALESAGDSCSAAVGINGDLAAIYTIQEQNKHDKFLAEFAKRLLDDLNIKPEELSAVAVSAGPGSFTGLRISGSIAKAMCFGNTPKLIAVPNLSALAYACINNNTEESITKISATIKAHKDLLYFQEFLTDFTTLTQPQIVTQDEYLKRDFTDTKICGTAANIFSNLNSDKYLCSLSAEYIADLAYKMYNENDFADSYKYTPLYVQDFQPKSNNL